MNLAMLTVIVGELGRNTAPKPPGVVSKLNKNNYIKN
jgi:hypothetical protein